MKWEWEDIIGQVVKKACAHWQKNKYSASLKSTCKWIIAIASIQSFIWFPWLYPYLKNLIVKSEDNKAAFETHSFFISLLFALIGVVFSIRTLVDSDKQAREFEIQREGLKETIKHLERISKSMSTRYIRSFPNHLKDIIKLVKDAEETICILADCADYGSFSNPKDHEKMIQAVRKAKVRGKNIEIRICGKTQAISHSSEFREEWQNSKHNTEVWINLRNKKKFQDRLKLFCKLNEKAIGTFDSDNCTRKEFEDNNRHVPSNYGLHTWYVGHFARHD